MKDILIRDKNGNPITQGDMFTFKYEKDLHDPIELTGKFVYNTDELRYEIEVVGSDKYTVLSYRGDGTMFDFEYFEDKHRNLTTLNNFRVALEYIMDKFDVDISVVQRPGWADIRFRHKSTAVSLDAETASDVTVISCTDLLLPFTKTDIV